MSPTLAQRIEDCAHEAFVRCPHGGILMGIVSGTEGLIWSQHLGYAHTEAGRRTTLDTRYRIGSVTKRVTGLMFQQLVDRRLVHPADPLVRHLPEFRTFTGRFPSLAPLTLGQLLVHRSGLMRDALLPANALRGSVATWEQSLLSTLPHLNLSCEPGLKFSYSNCGYALLGAALARAAKRSFVDYIRDELLQPLGMTRTAFEPGPEPWPDTARGYEVVSGEPRSDRVEQQHRGRGYSVPQGGLYSTLSDLSKLLCFEMGHGPAGVLGKDPLLASRLDPLNGGPAGRGWYGAGLFGQPLGDSHLFWHSGNVAGYDAMYAFEPKSETGVILLRNASDATARAAKIVLSAFGATKRTGPEAI